MASSSALISEVVGIYQTNLVNMFITTSMMSYMCPHHLDRKSCDEIHTHLVEGSCRLGHRFKQAIGLVPV